MNINNRFENLIKKYGTKSLRIEFPDNNLATEIFGELNAHLALIERELNVRIDQFGNRLEVYGAQEDLRKTESLFEELNRKSYTDPLMNLARVTDTIRFLNAGVKAFEEETVFFRTGKGVIRPRSPAQIEYAKSFQNNDLVIGAGPAGTGKTYIAVAAAVDRLLSGAAEKLIITRPAVEAGEKLGFLPGDMKEKIDPYLRPIFDALGDMLHTDKLQKFLERGQIEIAPLAFMRGRTLRKSFVILDEAQNTTVTQMKMFLTRLGDDSKMAVNGDPDQIDLPKGVKSGLTDFLEIQPYIKGSSATVFTDQDVMRHPLVAQIIRAYAGRKPDGAFDPGLKKS